MVTKKECFRLYPNQQVTPNGSAKVMHLPTARQSFLVAMVLRSIVLFMASRCKREEGQVNLRQDVVSLNSLLKRSCHSYLA